ncbi:MAG: hypothetical protein IT410_01250 [Candidatus Doudnabacteria bacterium]|nr:hypothetical protein [Candidatus Doudnabacteria bacterium]
MKKVTLPHEIRIEAEKNASDFFKINSPEWKKAVRDYLTEFYMETQPNPTKDVKGQSRIGRPGGVAVTAAPTERPQRQRPETRLKRERATFERSENLKRSSSLNALQNPAPEEVKIAKKLYPEIFDKGFSKEQIMRLTMAAETLVNTILGLGIKIPNTGYSYESESNEESQRKVIQNRYRRFLIRILVYEMIANLTEIKNQDVEEIIQSANLDKFPIKTLESKNTLEQFGSQLKNRLHSFFKRLNFKDIIFKETEIKKSS